MRGFAAVTILILLGSAQCISACTLAACGEVQDSQAPPCHQHQKPAHRSTPADAHSKACDHQKAADETQSVSLDAGGPATLPELAGIASWSTSAALDFLAPLTAAPPGSPPSFSILRI